MFHVLTFLLFLALSFHSNAQTQNRINLGSSLQASNDNSATWKSPSGQFAAGFRPVGDQNLFLFAVWFDGIPDKTIVWQANGDNLAPTGSNIELTSNGEFKLSDPDGKILWEPRPVTNNVTHAALLDTGNLVLANGNSVTYSWASFNSPFDTILPTQVVEIGGVLSSRMSSTNHSRGKYQLRMLPQGNVVLNAIALPTDYAYQPYYRSGTSDDRNRMNSGYKLTFNESGNIYVVKRNGNETSLTSGSDISSRDFYFRATLDFDGLFTLYAHPKAPVNGSWTQAWSSVWYEPKDICFGMTSDMGSGACGFNAVCSLDHEGRPTCECLPGFSLTNPNDKYSDCKQDRVQRCLPGGPKPEELYEMRESSNTFWPTSANYERFPYSNEDYCARSCFDDCDCIVAVVKDGTCWKKRLPLSNGRVERDTYGKALVKVPRTDGSSGVSTPEPPDGGQKDRNTVTLVISILLGGSVFMNFLFLVAIVVAAYLSYQKRQGSGNVSSIMETNLRSFSYYELKEATDGFREELGRGAFGTVYKGVVSSSYSRTIVAVKRLDRMAQDGEKEFKAEASTIARTHHKNLVRLLGFCDEGPHRLLVYEFMSNGSLASFLFGISRPDWNKRIQMALGIARGLSYLHEECDIQIIHCDIKPQNILLDDTYTARISDFGLAKLLMNDQTRTNTVIRGTKGYVAPEWFRSTPVTAKVDVYSYGVMLLEIICCRKNVETERENEEEIILADWVYDCYRAEKLGKLVKDDEEARNDMKRLERLVMVGIWCIHEDPSLRPTMKKVTQMLEGVVEVLPPPSPSPFSSIFVERSNT